MKTSKKNLIELFNSLDGVDITYLAFDEMNELRKKEGYFKEIAYASGTYGVNAVILRGKNTDTFYGILSRTSNIFMI